MFVQNEHEDLNVKKCNQNCARLRLVGTNIGKFSTVIQKLPCNN